MSLTPSNEVAGTETRQPADGSYGPWSVRPLRVFVVDDHPMVRLGLARMIQAQDDFCHVGEAAEGIEAVRAIARLQPDVVLIDLVLPGLDGIGVIRALSGACTQTRFVVVSARVGATDVRRALNDGASGYLSKSVSAAELAAMIRLVHAGRRVMCPAVTDVMLSASVERKPGGDLTVRERQTLECLTRGMSNKDIAQRLAITLPTTKYHVTHILSKLGVTNRVEAVLLALKHQLVTPT